MRVLPVPQAMMAFALSWPSKQAWIWLMAACWWGRGLNVRAQREAASSAWPAMRSDQSTLEAAMSVGVNVNEVMPRFCLRASRWASTFVEMSSDTVATTMPV